MRLDLGSHVKTSDGEDIGTVSRIIFESDPMKVREFVVHEGILVTHDRIVHRDQIDHVDGDHVVHLRISASEARDLPPFIAEQHMAVYSGGTHHIDTPSVITTSGSVPRDAVVLSHRSEVYDSAGKHIGHLDEIVYDADGVSTSFIVDAGLIFTHDVVVPCAAIASVTHNRIELTITSEEAEESARV